MALGDAVADVRRLRDMLLFRWLVGDTDTARSLRLLAKALSLDGAEVAERAEHLAVELPSAVDDTINSLTVHEQDTLDRLTLVEQVMRRAKRFRDVGADLHRQIAAERSAEPHNAPDRDDDLGRSLNI